MQHPQRWYRVKGINDIRTYIRVVGERDHGYQIMIASFYEDFCRESTEQISRHLFDTCVRTGYLLPEDPPYSIAATEALGICEAADHRIAAGG